MPAPQRPAYVQQALQKDAGLCNTLKGMIVGHFTEAKWEKYIVLAHSLDKRIFQLANQRLQSQLDEL